MSMRQESLQELWTSGEAQSHPAGVDLEAAGHLRFVLRQSFHYRYDGPIATLDQRLIVVPPTRHGSQRRKSHRVSVVGAESRASWSRDGFANAVVRVRVPAVSESVQFQVEAIIERAGQTPMHLPVGALSDRRYLEATPLTAVDDALSSAAHDALSAVGPGLQAAERICEIVHRSLAYRKGATTVETTAAAAFAIGSGVCQDHAHVMIAMCRAVGIPARYVSGHMLGEGATHAWVEVLLPDAGGAVVVPFDPCHGRRPGAKYVTIAVGRDYRDVAPTAGTYRGGFSNQLTSGTRLDVSVVEPSSRRTA